MSKSRETRPRRINDSDPAADFTSEKSAPAAPPPAPEPEFSRLSIMLTPDGDPAWDRMQTKTQETLRRIMGKGTPGGAPSAKSVNPLVSQALVKAIVGAVPTLAAAAAQLLGFTAESSQRITLTDAQKAELIPLYQAALADYEIMLGRHENLIVALGMTGLFMLPGVQQLERRKKQPAGGPLLTMMEAPDADSAVAN